MLRSVLSEVNATSLDSSIPIMLLTAPSLGSGHLDTHLEPLTPVMVKAAALARPKNFTVEKNIMMVLLGCWVRRIFAIQRESFIKSRLYFSAIPHPSELSSFRSGAPEASPARAKFSQRKV